MPTRTFACLVPLLALLIASCNAAPEAATTGNAASSAAPPAASPRPSSASGSPALIQALGATCADAATARDCIIGNVEAGDFYDIEITARCDATGFFAGVTAATAALLDTLPVTGSNAKPAAELASGQFLCVQAIARSGQNPAYYYVAAIPPSSIPACRDNAACARYGDRPVKREAPSAAKAACTVDAQGVPQGDCARGWIEPGAIDAFSNGL